MRTEHKHIILLFLIISIALVVLLLAHFATVPVMNSSYSTRERAAPPWAYPDRNRTPGAANPDITQANAQNTICNPNWSTKSVRPSSSYTTKLKREQLEELRLPGILADYEEDHLIPLELGGDPKDPRNLWPEPYQQPGAREKDIVENYLHKQVCAGNMTLGDAQRAIATDWYLVFREIHPEGTQVNQPF